MPPEFHWPMYTHDDGIDVPMHFLVQINLGELPVVDGMPVLPRTGTLFVFYDPTVAPYADDGAAMGRGRGAKVIYSKYDWRLFPARKAPDMPDVSEYDLANAVTSRNWSRPPSTFWGQMRSPSYPKWAFSPSIADNYQCLGEELPPDCIERAVELIKKRSSAREVDCPLLDQNGLMDERHFLFGASQRQFRPDFYPVHSRKDPENRTDPQDYVLLFSFAPDRRISHQFMDGLGVGIWLQKRDLEELHFDRLVVWSEDYG